MNQDVRNRSKVEAHKTEQLMLSIYAGCGLLLSTAVLAGILSATLTLASSVAHRQSTIVTQQIDTRPEPPAVVGMMWAVKLFSATA